MGPCWIYLGKKERKEEKAVVASLSVLSSPSGLFLRDVGFRPLC